MAFLWGRRHLANGDRSLEASPHRTRVNNFFLVERWAPEAALRQTAPELRRSLRPGQGEPLSWVLADSTPTKRRQALEAVAKLQDPTTEADIQGHQDVWAIVVYRAHVMPVGLRLDVQTTPCPTVGVTCRKPTEWAAQLIRECKPPRGVKVLSLFEADDLGPMGVKAGRAPPFHFASPLQSHRRLFKQGWQRKAGRYGRQLPRRRRPDPLALTKPDGQVRDRGVDAGWLEVSTLGPLHVVFSRKGMATKSLGLVTDAPALSAADVIGTDAKRWTMEPWRKAVKPWLGLG